MLSDKAAQVEVSSALAEVEAIVGAEVDFGAKFGGGGGGGGSGGVANKKALAVKRLVEKAKAADAELAAIKQQLAAAKASEGVDAEEVAELRRQLKLARAASAPPGQA